MDVDITTLNNSFSFSRLFINCVERLHYPWIEVGFFVIIEIESVQSFSSLQISGTTPRGVSTLLYGILYCIVLGVIS